MKRKALPIVLNRATGGDILIQLHKIAYIEDLPAREGQSILKTTDGDTIHLNTTARKVFDLILPTLQAL